jgi:hypothetical protein
MVPLGSAGPIYVNRHLLPTSLIKEEFFTVLNEFRSSLSREWEAGRRPIIALFLSHAVIQARELYKIERLAVHSEIAVPYIQIPEVGLVGGTLDFMVANVIGFGPMGKSFVVDSLISSTDYIMKTRDATAATPTEPTFVIVEVKRTVTFHDTSSIAELVGQIKSQMIRRYCLFLYTAD